MPYDVILNDGFIKNILSDKFKAWPVKEFKSKKAEEIIFSPLPDSDEFKKNKKAMKESSLRNVIPELHHFYEFPLLNKNQEFHLFRQMNFFKNKCKKISLKYSKTNCNKLFSDLKTNYIKYLESREFIVKCNLRLSYQMFKHRKDFYGHNTNDLLSDSFLNIIKAVDGFDYTRGFKFSTYCTWCLLNNSIRDQNSNKKFESFMATNLEEKNYDCKLDLKDQDIIDTFDKNEIIQHDWNKIKNMLISQNNERSFYILTQIFGIGCNKKTLKELSEELNLTKERIRQIKEKTIKSLKDLVEKGDLKLIFERDYDKQ
jgi:RNA polymerase sigma factor (sigma-70 family)